MKIARELRFFRYQMTTRLVYTPFAMALGSGTLDLEVFDSFIELERVILHEFPKMYDIVKDQVSDTDVKVEFQQLKTSALFQHSDVKHDLQHEHPDVRPDLQHGHPDVRHDLQHEHPDVKHGLQHVEGGCSGVAAKYIGFLREIGRKGKAHHILAAILPAMRTYKYLAEFLSEYASSENPFLKWISTYSSDEFHVSVMNMEKILNKLVVRPGKKQLRNLFRISTRAKRLVAEILHALTQPTIIPLKHNHPGMVLYVGFDINAVEDTEDVDHAGEHIGWCSCLFDFESTSALPRKEETQENDEYEQTVNVLRTASYFMSQKSESCIEKITPLWSIAYSFSTLEEEFKNLTECEKEAKKELMKSSLLKGLKEEHITQFGKQFSFKSLICFDLFSKFGNRANVVSSSFCGANVVKEVLSKDLFDLQIKLALKKVAVYSNELCFKQGSCTGDFQLNVQSATNKLRIFMDEVEKECGLTIYVGESVNDLLALMKANIGIVVNPNSRLLKVAPQFGIKCVSLYSGILDKLKLVRSSKKVEAVQSIWKADSGVLYTVDDWEQLYFFLFGEPEEPKKLKSWEKESTTDDDCWSSGTFIDYKDEFANTPEDDYLKYAGTKAYMNAFMARLEDEVDIFSVDDREDYLSDADIPIVNDTDSDFEDEDYS